MKKILFILLLTIPFLGFGQTAEEYFEKGFDYTKSGEYQLAIDNFKIEPQEILFVGDNFSLDVVGAKKVGMKSAWVNREGKTISKDIESDYELSSLDDLLCIGTPVV